MNMIREDSIGLYIQANGWRFRPWPGKNYREYERVSALELELLSKRYHTEMTVPTKTTASKFSNEVFAKARIISQTSILVVKCLDGSFGELWFREDNT